jgi:hypothetical protein
MLNERLERDSWDCGGVRQHTDFTEEIVDKAFAKLQYLAPLKRFKSSHCFNSSPELRLILQSRTFFARD